MWDNSEIRNRLPLLGHVIWATDLFPHLLIPLIVGTFIYSDILSDSQVGSENGTRRGMGSCPQKEHSLVWMHADVMWQPWIGEEKGAFCSLPPSHPAISPSRLLQPHLTITMQDSIYSTMSLCTHGPFPWHALERDTYTLTHMYAYVRARDLSTRAQWRKKWKWHFLAFAAWLVFWAAGAKRGGDRGNGTIWNGCGWG